MFELGKLTVYKAIIHSVDKGSEKPQFSALELADNEELTMDILSGYIEKIYTSNKKFWSLFKNESELELFKNFNDNMDDFVKITKELTIRIHDTTKKLQSFLPSCELAFVLFEMNNSIYFSCIKMNHQDIIVSYAKKVDDGTVSSIKKQNMFYTKSKPKVEEGFIMNLEDMDIALLDKIYPVEGEKVRFFSEMVFKMQIEVSEYEKLKRFESINKRVIDKFVGDNIEKQTEIKKALIESIEDGKLNTLKFLEAEIFDNDLKAIMQSSLQKSSLNDTEIDINQAFEKKNMMQNITTGSGIKINIPIDYVSDKERFEIEYNSNGTTSMVIKNIEEFKII